VHNKNTRLSLPSGTVKQSLKCPKSAARVGKPTDEKENDRPIRKGQSGATRKQHSTTEREEHMTNSSRTDISREKAVFLLGLLADDRFFFLDKQLKPFLDQVRRRYSLARVTVRVFACRQRTCSTHVRENMFFLQNESRKKCS